MAEFVWKLAVLPGGTVPVQEFLDRQARQKQQSAYLLSKLQYTVRLGWATSMAQRRFEPISGIDDIYEFRTTYGRVQLRVFFTTYATEGDLWLVALAATDEKHGRGKLPVPLKETIRTRLRTWRVEHRALPFP